MIANILPAPAVIIRPAEIPDMIYITKWAVLIGRISATKGRRTKERLVSLKGKLLIKKC
jgi:hypothetical protein